MRRSLPSTRRGVWVAPLGPGAPRWLGPGAGGSPGSSEPPQARCYQPAGFHRSLLHGSLIRQTAASKVMKAPEEGAEPERDGWRGATTTPWAPGVSFPASPSLTEVMEGTKRARADFLDPSEITRVAPAKPQPGFRGNDLLESWRQGWPGCAPLQAAPSPVGHCTATFLSRLSAPKAQPPPPHTPRQLEAPKPHISTGCCQPPSLSSPRAPRDGAGLWGRTAGLTSAPARGLLKQKPPGFGGTCAKICGQKTSTSGGEEQPAPCFLGKRGAHTEAPSHGTVAHRLVPPGIAWLMAQLCTALLSLARRCWAPHEQGVGITPHTPTPSQPHPRAPQPGPAAGRARFAVSGALFSAREALAQQMAGITKQLAVAKPIIYLIMIYHLTT